MKKWSDVEQELFTSEEIRKSKLRIANIGELLKVRKENCLMNNEEKILGILEQMQMEVNQRFDNLEQEVAITKNTVIKMESEYLDKIRCSLDGFVYNRDKGIQLEQRVSTLEDVSQKHTVQLNVLTKR